MHTILSTVIFLSVVQWSAADGRPEVDTKLGKIRGITQIFNGTIVNAFLGVPYAVPPTGQLRFKRPQPAKPWPQYLDASNFTSACYQYSDAPYPWYDNMTGYSEDCLTLNIWVPTGPRIPKAVLYWIHGGELTFGSNRIPIYHGDVFAAVGDVIMVTVNYRLGPLGFLYSATDDAPGNVGIYDILQGLKWVTENIGAFGGDKNNITIGGHDVGAHVVGFFTLSPLANGLFKRVISQSGSPIAEPDAREENLKLGQELAKAVNCTNNTVTIREKPQKVVECLRGVDAMKLVKVTTTVLKPRSSSSFTVVYGDPIVGEDPRQRLRNGSFPNVDTLIGNVQSEASFRITTLHPDIFGFHGENNTLFNKTYGEELIRENFASSPDKERAVKYYLSSLDDSKKPEIRDKVIQAISDFSLTCPGLYYAEKFAQKNNSVYYYSFTQRPSNTSWAPWMGVVHMDEVPFIFGLPVRNPQFYSKEEADLSKKLIKLWSNFTKTGNPGEDFPRFEIKSHKVRILNVTRTPQDEDFPHLESCDFLRPYFGMLDTRKS